MKKFSSIKFSKQYHQDKSIVLYSLPRMQTGYADGKALYTAMPQLLEYLKPDDLDASEMVCQLISRQHWFNALTTQDADNMMLLSGALSSEME